MKDHQAVNREEHLMTLTTLLLLAPVAALLTFKLGALILAGYWAAQGAFTPKGLLAPARTRHRAGH